MSAILTAHSEEKEVRKEERKGEGVGDGERGSAEWERSGRGGKYR